MVTTVLRDMIHAADVDGDSTIDFPVRLWPMGRMVKDSDTAEELVDTFKVFDHGGNGFISAAELRHVTMYLNSTIDFPECL